MKHFFKEGTRKGTIVFIHGNSSSSEVFRSILDSNEIEQTKIAVDLPGHGTNLNGFNPEIDFTVDSICKKLITFTDQIDDDILLVGNSLGGHLAIEIANKIERLKGLVIFGTPPLKKPVNFEEAFLPSNNAPIFFVENSTDVEVEKVFDSLVYKKENMVELINVFKKTETTFRKAIADDVAGNAFSDEYESFTHLKIPKFMLVGLQDPFVNPNYLEELYKKCNGRCELISIDKCGHFPSIEQPEEFLKIMAKIVDEVFD